MSTSSTSSQESEATTAVVPPESDTPREGTQAATFAVIPVDKLKPHPKHVRGDMKLTRQYVASIASAGVKEALDVTPIPEEPGFFRIIEGHRRWEGAGKAGRTEVPCVVHWDLADNQARQHLQQYVANDPELRHNHNEREQTLALTLAIEAGASRTEVRKELGLSAKQVQQAIKAGKLSDTGYQRATRQVEDSYELTVLELAVLAEFEGDEEATERLLSRRRRGEPMEAVAEDIRQERADQTEHERLVAELTAAGVAVTEDLPAGALELDELRTSDDGGDGDGEDGSEEDVLDGELHRECPGRGVHFPYALTEPVEYCADPVKHGHGFVDVRLGQRMRLRAELIEAGETVTEGLSPGGWRLENLEDKDGQELTVDNHRQCPGARVYVPRYGPPEPVHYCMSAGVYGHRSRTGRAARLGLSETTKAPDEPSRKLVVTANREWLSAAKARRTFLGQLLRRRTAPQGTMAFLADQLLTMPNPVRTGLGTWKTEPLFREFTGKSLTDAKQEAERAATGRLHTLVLAELVAAMEYEVAGDGDRRNTWRTDRANPYCSRDEASAYLKFLVDNAGHKATAIEKAVIAKTRYTGIDPDQEAMNSGTALKTTTAGDDQGQAADGTPEPAGEAVTEHADQRDGDEPAGDSRPRDDSENAPHEVPDVPGAVDDGGAPAEAA